MFKFWGNRRADPIRVVIVGAGFAGLSAARQLEKRDDVEIPWLDSAMA